MVALTIELPDDVYSRVQARASERGVSPQEQVVDIVTRSEEPANGQALDAARARMRELFRSVSGFRMTPKFSREELHDRGRLR